MGYGDFNEVVMDKFPVDSKFFIERRKANVDETGTPVSKETQQGTSHVIASPTSIGADKSNDKKDRHVPQYVREQTANGRLSKNNLFDPTNTRHRSTIKKSQTRNDDLEALEKTLNGAISYKNNPNFNLENLVYHRNGRTFANIRWPVDLVHSVYNLNSLLTANGIKADDWLKMTFDGGRNPRNSTRSRGSYEPSATQYRFFDLNNTKRKGTIRQCVKRLLTSSQNFEPLQTQSLARQGRLLGIKSSRGRGHICMNRNGDLMTADELQDLYFRFEQARYALTHNSVQFDQMENGELLGIYAARKPERRLSNGMVIDFSTVTEIIYLVLQTLSLLSSDKTTESVTDFGRPRPPRNFGDASCPPTIAKNDTRVSSSPASPAAENAVKSSDGGEADLRNLIARGVELHVDSNSSFCDGCTTYLLTGKGKVIDWPQTWELELRDESGNTAEFSSPTNMSEPVTCVVIGAEEWSKFPEPGTITVTLRGGMKKRFTTNQQASSINNNAPVLLKKVYKPDISIHTIDLPRPRPVGAPSSRDRGDAEVLFAETGNKSMNFQGCHFMFLPQTPIRCPMNYYIKIENKTRGRSLVFPIQECGDIMRYIFNYVEDLGDEEGGYGGLYFFTGGKINPQSGKLEDARFWQHDVAQFVLSAVPAKDI